MSSALSKQSSATGSSQQNVDHVGRGKEQSNNATNKLRNYETFINTLFNLFFHIICCSQLETQHCCDGRVSSKEYGNEVVTRSDRD